MRTFLAEARYNGRHIADVEFCSDIPPNPEGDIYDYESLKLQLEAQKEFARLVGHTMVYRRKFSGIPVKACDITVIDISDYESPGVLTPTSVKQT